MHLHHRLSLVLISFTLAGAASAYPEYKVTVVGPANSLAADINNAAWWSATIRILQRSIMPSSIAARGWSTWAH